MGVCERKPEDPRIPRRPAAGGEWFPPSHAPSARALHRVVTDGATTRWSSKNAPSASPALLRSALHAAHLRRRRRNRRHRLRPCSAVESPTRASALSSSAASAAGGRRRWRRRGGGSGAAAMGRTAAHGQALRSLRDAKPWAESVPADRPPLAAAQPAAGQCGPSARRRQCPPRWRKPGVGQAGGPRQRCLRGYRRWRHCAVIVKTSLCRHSTSPSG
jgi:hypothetical protein